MSNLEDVAPSVADHCPPVAVWGVEGSFHAQSAGADSSFVDGVSVIDVDIEKSGKHLAFISPRHHDERVTDADLGGDTAAHLATGAEHVAQESAGSFRIADDHSGSDRMKSGRSLLRRHVRDSSNSIPHDGEHRHGDRCLIEPVTEVVLLRMVGDPGPSET